MLKLGEKSPERVQTTHEKMVAVAQAECNTVLLN
jgi:hypothetical protein